MSHLYPMRRAKCKQIWSRCVWNSGCLAVPPQSGQTWGGQPWWMRWWAAALQLLGSSMGGEHSVQGWRTTEEERPTNGVSSLSYHWSTQFMYVLFFLPLKRLTEVCAGLISWKCSATSSLLLNWAWHSGHLLLMNCNASAFFLDTVWCGWGFVFGVAWPFNGDGPEEEDKRHLIIEIAYRQMKIYSETAITLTNQLWVPAGQSSAPQERVSSPGVNTAWSGLSPCALWRGKAGCTCCRRLAAWHSGYRSPRSSASAGRSAALNSAPGQRHLHTPNSGNPAGDQTFIFFDYHFIGNKAM